MRQVIGVAVLVLLGTTAFAAEPEKVAEPAAAPEASPAAADKPAESAAVAPVKKKAKARIAVLDVRTAGTLDPKTFEGLSGLIASEIATRAPDVHVIGSGDIRAMVGFEREKQLMGCSESACLAEIGGALGVEWMLTTEGSKLGSTWILTMVLIDVPKSRPVKRLSQRTDQENKLVEEAVAAVQQMVLELPRDEAAPKVVAATEVKPAEGRNKVLTWGLVGGGALAVIAGSALVGAGWVVRNSYRGDDLAGYGTSVTRNEAKNANTMAISGYVVGAVGIAAVVWGGVRLGLADPSPVQVSVAPTPGGAHASMTVVLP